MTTWALPLRLTRKFHGNVSSYCFSGLRIFMFRRNMLPPFSGMKYTDQLCYIVFKDGFIRTQRRKEGYRVKPRRIETVNKGMAILYTVALEKAVFMFTASSGQDGFLPYLRCPSPSLQNCRYNLFFHSACFNLEDGGRMLLRNNGICL